MGAKVKKYESQISMEAGTPTYKIIYDGEKNIIDYQNVKIAGYANTFGVDRVGDISIPGAFEKYLPEFKTNPILLFDHDRSMVGSVGKVTTAFEDGKGLNISAEISNSPDCKNLRFKVAERVFRTFSVGGKFLVRMQKNGQRRLEQIHLREISIVPIPCAPGSVFEVKASGEKLEQDLIVQKKDRAIPNGKLLDDDKPGEVIIEGQKKQELKNLEKGVLKMENGIKKDDMIDQVKSELKAELKAEALAELKIVEDKKAERATIVSEVKKDLLAKQEAEIKKIEGAKNETEKNKLQILKRGHLDKTTEALLDLVKSDAGGDLTSEFDVQYAESMIEGKKADLDGAASYGATLPPEEQANRLYVRMAELGGGLFGKFPKAIMTSDVQTIQQLQAPIDIAAYSSYQNQNLAVGAVTASAPSTGNQTLTARTFIAKTNVYDILAEDTKVNLIRGVQDSMAIALDNAISEAILNGDDTGTHMDEDYEAEGANIPCALFYGLRRLGRPAASTDCTNGGFTLSELSTIESTMGKFAVGDQVKNALWVFGVKGIGKLKGLLAAKTGNLADAVVKNGVIQSYLGHAITVSEFQREVLEIDGFFDTSGVAASQGHITLVNTLQFLIGLRNKLTVKIVPDPLNGRKQIQGIIRLDFQALETPSSTHPIVVSGYGFTA